MSQEIKSEVSEWKLNNTWGSPGCANRDFDLGIYEKMVNDEDEDEPKTPIEFLALTSVVRSGHDPVFTVWSITSGTLDFGLTSVRFIVESLEDSRSVDDFTKQRPHHTAGPLYERQDHHAKYPPIPAVTFTQSRIRQNALKSQLVKFNPS